MAKIKNASFQGSDYFTVEPDAVTQKNWLYNAIGDLSFLEEQARGAGANIFHLGNGDGTRLGFPLANQIFFEYGIFGDGAAGKFVFFMPIFIPENETDLTVLIKTTASQAHNVVIYDAPSVNFAPPVTLTTLITGLSNVVPFNDEIKADLTIPKAYTDDGTSAGGGAVKILAVSVADTPKEAAYYKSISVYPRRSEPQSVIGIDDNQSGTDSALQTQTISGATAYKLNEFEDDAVAEDLPITGLHLTRIIKSQNALAEYITGAPAGQNGAVGLASSGATNPTRSAFYDHSTSGTNGDPVSMPIFAMPCGNAKVSLIDYFTVNDNGIYKHSTPPGRTSGGAGTITVRNGVYYMPDFPTGGSSYLKACFYILCSDTTTSTIQAEIECFNSSGTGAGASTVALSNGGAAGVMVLYASGVDFHADQYNRVRIRLTTDANNQTKTNNVAHFSLLGAAAYFQP